MDPSFKPIVQPTGSAGSVGAVIDSKAVAKEFADLKMASDTRPANFTGGAGDEVETWIRDDRRMLVQAPIYLDSFAANWYDKETNEGTKVPWKVWGDFTDALVKRFRPKDLTQRYKLDMRRRRQRADEDIGEYFNDKMTECYLVNPKMDDEDVIQQLKEGLQDAFFNHVVLSKAKTPVDFYEDLVLAQTAIKRKEKMS